MRNKARLQVTLILVVMLGLVAACARKPSTPSDAQIATAVQTKSLWRFGYPKP